MNPSKDLLDPIALSLLWSSFLSVTDEMGSTLRRTAFSQAVREADDFSTGIFDQQGRLVAQGNFTPGHLGAMPFVVQTALKHFPAEKLAPGDAIVLNDSAMGSGHYPDFYMVSPVFHAGQLVGFVANIAHQVDVGGSAPGSQQVLGITQAYQEGLRILPIKLVVQGEFDEQLLRLICGNVRMPELLKGDVAAQRNANHVGALRLAAIYEKFGHEEVVWGIESIFDRSETRMKELIAQIPAGRYSFDDQLDRIEPEGEPIRVAVDITVAADCITVDFSRSSDQVPAAINAYENFTRAHTLFAVRAFTDPFMPQNDGAIRPVKLVGRQGSFFNPVFPAPSGGRAAIQVRIFEVINGAFAQILPERAMAAFSHWSNPIIGGVDGDGKSFIYYDLIFGGYGARAYADGVEGLAPVINCANIPVEVHETGAPIKIRCLELIQDSGGAGKYRGACGIRKDVELTAGEGVLTLLGDRHVRAPYGLFGGQSGALAQTILNSDGVSRALESKERRPVKAGDVVSLRLAGAGGYGAPAERSRAAIEMDVAEGYISVAAAREIYGYEPNPAEPGVLQSLSGVEQ